MNKKMSIVLKRIAENVVKAERDAAEVESEAMALVAYFEQEGEALPYAAARAALRRELKRGGWSQIGGFGFIGTVMYFAASVTEIAFCWYLLCIPTLIWFLFFVKHDRYAARVLKLSEAVERLRVKALE